MILEAIEREINAGRAVPVAEGCGGNCHVVEVGGKKFLHKKYPTHPTGEGEESVERARFNSFKFGMPSTCYIDNNVSAAQRAKKEFSTIQAWNRIGISTADPIACEGNRIVYGFMHGYSFANSMNGESLNEKDFGRILNCFHSIRGIAGRMRDIELLHNDPFADNFSYDEQRKSVVPLDPGKVLVNDDFDITDGRINLFFLCKIFHLRTTLENQEHYLKQAVERMTSKERSTVHSLNTDPTEARAYFESMGTKWGAHKLSVYYSRETLGAIERVLTK